MAVHVDRQPHAILPSGRQAAPWSQRYNARQDDARAEGKSPGGRPGPGECAAELGAAAAVTDVLADGGYGVGSL